MARSAIRFLKQQGQFNTRIADATFRWTPPAGIRVIDAGKLGR